MRWGHIAEWVSTSDSFRMAAFLKNAHELATQVQAVLFGPVVSRRQFRRVALSVGHRLQHACRIERPRHAV